MSSALQRLGSVSCSFERMKGSRLVQVASALALTAGAYSVIAKLRRRAQEKAWDDRAKSRTPGVVYLHMFPRTGSCLQISAPCLTVEAFVRCARIPYVAVYNVNINESPNGAFPFIELDGERIADSRFIIQRLQSRFADLVARNVPRVHDGYDLALSVALHRQMISSIRFAHLRISFVDFVQVAQRRFDGMFPDWVPGFLRRVIVNNLRSQHIALLNAEGYGWMSTEEYRSEVATELHVLERLAQSATSRGRAFLVSEAQPTEVDCIVFARLAQLRDVMLLDDVLGKLHHGELSDYLDRVEAKLFPDGATLKALDSGAKAKPRGFGVHLHAHQTEPRRTD